VKCKEMAPSARYVGAMLALMFVSGTVQAERFRHHARQAAEDSRSDQLFT
jgi:hypothetical protein